MKKKQYNKKLLSYALIRFLSLPAALILTAILLIVFLSTSSLSGQTALYIFLISATVESLVWLLWLATTLKKSDRQEHPRLLKINVLIVVLYAGFLSLGYNLIFGYKLDMTEQSPCGKYKVEVFIPRFRFAMPGGGGLYSNPVRVVLRNKLGFPVGWSDRNNPPVYMDLQFEWDYKESLFWYTKVEYIKF